MSCCAPLEKGACDRYDRGCIKTKVFSPRAGREKTNGRTDKIQRETKKEQQQQQQHNSKFTSSNHLKIKKQKHPPQTPTDAATTVGKPEFGVGCALLKGKPPLFPLLLLLVKILAHFHLLKCSFFFISKVVMGRGRREGV